MDELQFFMVFSIILSGIFWFLLLKLPLRELQHIEADADCVSYQKLLETYKSPEIKRHIEIKYQERVDFLLKVKGIHPFWWKIYKIGEKNNYNEI